MRRGTWLVGFVVVAATRSAAAEPCPVTAVLEGNAELVDVASEVLAVRGIATRERDDCPAAKVQIDRRGPSSITVSITDATGRRVERAFADVETAVALIESWARADENASLLAGWTVAATARPSSPAAALVTTVRGSPPRAPRLWLAAAPEFSVDNAGASWFGGRGQACVRIGRICPGVIVRTLAADERSGVDAMAALDVHAVPGSRISVVVGVATGVGWFTAPHPSNDLRQTLTFAALRLDAHATFGIAITRWAWIDFGLAAGGSPSAAPVVVMGESTRRLDEPSAFVRGELGLRIGVK